MVESALDRRLRLHPGKRRAPRISTFAGRRGWCIPQPVQSFGVRLLGQQLWCWGRDIARPEGNLLTEFGFRRHRAKDHGRAGSSCYRLDADDHHVALWGFGMFYGRRGWGGLYLGRFSFRPQWANIEALSLGIHATQDLPRLERPKSQAQWERAHRLWHELLSWIMHYERWTQRTAGLEYRQRCVAEWLFPFVAAENMPQAWLSLRRRVWETNPQRWRSINSTVRVRTSTIGVRENP